MKFNDALNELLALHGIGVIVSKHFLNMLLDLHAFDGASYVKNVISYLISNDYFKLLYNSVSEHTFCVNMNEQSNILYDKYGIRKDVADEIIKGVQEVLIKEKYPVIKLEHKEILTIKRFLENHNIYIKPPILISKTSKYENSQDYIVYMKLPEEIDGQSALVLSHRAANLIKNDSSEIKNLIVSYANGCWGIISNNSTILYDNYDL